jgi:hypothetical protein
MASLIFIHGAAAGTASVPTCTPSGIVNESPA